MENKYSSMSRGGCCESAPCRKQEEDSAALVWIYILRFIKHTAESSMVYLLWQQTWHRSSQSRAPNVKHLPEGTLKLSPTLLSSVTSKRLKGHLFFTIEADGKHIISAVTARRSLRRCFEYLGQTAKSGFGGRYLKELNLMNVDKKVQGNIAQQWN